MSTFPTISPEDARRHITAARSRSNPVREQIRERLSPSSGDEITGGSCIGSNGDVRTSPDVVRRSSGATSGRQGTIYQTVNRVTGQKGPAFPTMTAASLFVVGTWNCGDWDVLIDGLTDWGWEAREDAAATDSVAREEAELDR